MADAPKNLFEGATRRGRIVRQGDLACIIMDGAGSMVVNMQDLMQVKKWAQSRPATANTLSDRGRFLEKFDVMIARPHSLQPTRGNQRNIERMAKAMFSAGFDLSEWMLPPELKRIGHAPIDNKQASKASSDNDDESGQTSDADQDSGDPENQ